jgi:hypothetical protein
MSVLCQCTAPVGSGGVPGSGGTSFGSGGFSMSGGFGGNVGGNPVGSGGFPSSGGLPPASGGAMSDGGAASSGGSTGTGGATSDGGSPGTGGAMSDGGAATGGALGSGGTTGTGGTPATGGTGTGGVAATGGALGTGGVAATGGALGTGGVTATGGTTSTGGAVGTGGATSTGCLQAGSGDYSKNGPYAVTGPTTVDLGTFATLPSTPTTYSIYYPTNMNDGCPHPVVAWGNGTSVTGPQVYEFFHKNLASWGLVVIASDNPNSAGGLTGGTSQDVFLKPAIDYMIAQNAASSSQFFQKLSSDYGTAGHSQGAIAATAASHHPNVRAEAQVEGGGTPKAGIAFLALSGTNDTIVGTQAPTASYNAATGPSLLAIYTGADHTTTPTLAGWIQQNAGSIAFVRLYTAWFRCYLAGDQTACGVFKGQGCGVCSDSNWATLQSKNL